METTIKSTNVTTLAAQVINQLNKTISNSPTGVSFARINNYVNSSGEVSNITINIGINYANVKSKDLEYLQKLNINSLTRNANTTLNLIKLDKQLLKEAQNALIASQLKPNVNRSKAQTEAYTRIKGASQIKVHNETGCIYLEGYVVKKEVLKKGEYKTVNSRPLTIAKNTIKKGMRASKIRQYKLTNLSSLKLGGNTIEFIK